LHTTANDYARFLSACLKDEKYLEHALRSHVSLVKDKTAVKEGVSKETLASVDWGLGFGLQTTKSGESNPIAFHWGDGPGAKAFFAMDSKSRSALVYFANSDNGLAIADSLVEPVVGNLQHGFNWLFKKEGFMKLSSPDWKKYHDYLHAGIDAEKKGDFASAILSYRTALKIKPDNSKLEYRIKLAEAHQSPSIPTIAKLKELEGKYNFLKFSVLGATLRVESGGQRDLIAINDNTFLDGEVILQFNLTNTPPSLTYHWPHGMQGELTRTMEVESKLSSVSKTTKKLNIPLSALEKSKDCEISAEEMAKSAFGQGSNVAKSIQSADISKLKK
ncbi:MAG TPA: hypothetical protein VHM20_02070, partial [Gammaproteobacteria bacterium]|nr:hypothetical protein [Gammaproteobacteria bacterium]